MKTFKLAPAAFRALAHWAMAITAAAALMGATPSFADEISVMFKPDGATATKPYGIKLDDDDDGALVMRIRDSEENKRKLFETIENIVKNGIAGSITAIFSWEVGKIPTSRQRHQLREQVLFNGEFGQDGRYYLIGHTHQGLIIRWYLPTSGEETDEPVLDVD